MGGCPGGTAAFGALPEKTGIRREGTALPLPLSLLTRLGQHVLDEDAIPLGGLIDHHVGHRPHDLPVLDNGAAAHE